MAWAKQRAIEYADAGDATGAIASMMSDLGKHDETRDMVDFCALAGMLHASDARSARTFIEGFA
jgi:hypothetical protein